MSSHQGQDGFTLVELLVAVFILVVGVTALLGVFAASARLSVVAESNTTMVHRAQRELERIESLPFAQAAMAAAPAASSDPSSPAYYVAAGPPATFSYDRNSSASEPLAIDSTNGTITPTATAWTDGRLTGSLYAFVTWTSDPNCTGGTICPASRSYRRVTVEITLNGATHPSHPAIVSSMIADPNATPSGAPANSAQNPLQSPTTQCQNGAGQLVACTNGLGTGTPNTWFLYDTPAITFAGSLFGAYNTTRQAIAGNHATHPTIALLNSLQCIPLSLLYAGCQNPDLMGASPPPQDAATPATPYCYATDVGCPLASAQPPGGVTVGGRTIRRDSSSCAVVNPWTQTDNRKGAFWVTPSLAASTTLTGDGGMTLYAQGASGVVASATICVGIYVVPASLLGLITLVPVQLGVVAYTTVGLPGVPTPVSFNFDFLAAGATRIVALGNRIGVRVWVAAAASTDVTLIYDHPESASQLQLNSQ
jgi:prepilin-type N-terminal cleavage/methylation domain-containing protein